MSENNEEEEEVDEKAVGGDGAGAAATLTLDAPGEKDDSEKTSEEIQLDWYRNVYQGDNVPQFTLRAVILGGLLGGLMSVSNLYTAIKLGWLFGVAITACVLSFTIWRIVRFIFPKVSEMGILENNCMQSTASSAGYSTGSTIATAFGAYLLITGKQIDWHITLVWTFITALLGVLLAVPMKRQMINKERLPFPSGIAAAETLKSLHGGSKESIKQAYFLLAAMLAGTGVGIACRGDYWWQKGWFKLPDFIPFNWSLQHVQLAKFNGFGFEPSLMLISAGMIVGLRAALSMFISSCVLYFGFGPWLVQNHIIPDGHKIISGWALWGGTSLMVSSGLTAFALQWRTILRALSSISNKGADKGNPFAEFDHVEVPTSWFLIGIIPLTIAFSILEYVAFHVDFYLGILSVLMSFFLALVACRSTGETDITPIGAMGKISQLIFAVLKPQNITVNLMAASVTANTASASADLLTDLKSGYLLGANARKQFLAQLCGVFFGTVTVVPAWYLMIKDKAALEAYNPPMTIVYKAVAEALSNGINTLPLSARYGILIGALLGLLLTLIEAAFPRMKKFLPSAMGLGLAWVFPFKNCLAFLMGALFAFVWKKAHQRTADAYTIPIASGAIAGESLACAFISILNALAALHVL